MGKNDVIGNGALLFAFACSHWVLIDFKMYYVMRNVCFPIRINRNLIGRCARVCAEKKQMSFS